MYKVNFSALITLFFCLMSGVVSGQDVMAWSNENLLQWEDFKAEPLHNSPRAASINSGLKFSWKTKYDKGKQELIYEVYAYMRPSKSWVKPSNKNDYLLQHEQLHFDISEYHARKLREIFKAYKIKPTVKRDLSKIYKTIERDRQRMQNKYDKETQHGLDTITQKQWQDKVDQLLHSQAENN